MLNSKYRISIIESTDEWAKISEPWDKLLQQSKSDTIFLTWEWLYTWGKHYLGKDRSLFLLVFYEGNEIVGIAPWYIHSFNFGPFTLRQIEFLGCPEAGSDYIDVFTKERKEKEIAQLVYHYLFSEIAGRWDLIMFQNMPSHSLFLLNFLQEIKKNRKYYEIQDGAFCPFLFLPGKREEFNDGLSQSRRRRITYDTNVLNRDSKVNYQTFQPMNEAIPLERFIALYKQKWGKNKEEFCSFLKDFLSLGGEKKWVNIDILSVNGKDIAGLFLLRYQDTLFMYLMAVDTDYNRKISVGNVLTALSIEKAISDGFLIYDFLKGDEEYKFYWAKEGKRSLNLFACQKKPGTMFFVSKKLIKHLAKVILK